MAADDLVAARAFHELASERLAVDRLGEDRLAETGVRMFLTGGNDDEPAILEVLEKHEGEHVIAARTGSSSWTRSTR